MCPVSINEAVAACIPLVPFHVVRRGQNAALVTRNTISCRLADQLQIAGDVVVQLRPKTQKPDSSVRKLIDRIKAGGFKLSAGIDGIKENTLKTYLSRLKASGLVTVSPDKTVVWCGGAVKTDNLRFGASGELKMGDGK